MRIGINVPDELLQKVKGTQPPVNVSQVCRDALERYVEVSDRARAQTVADGVDEHVIRLAKSVQTPMIEPDWEACALDDARDWVRATNPESWPQFMHQCEVLRRQKRDEAEMVDIWSQGGGCKGLLLLLDEHSEWFEGQFELQFESDVVVDPYDKAREEYSRAWLGYVYEVRRKLEDHYRAEYQKVMAERAEERRSRKVPQLPPFLVDWNR